MRCVVLEISGGGAEINPPPPPVLGWLRPPPVRGLRTPGIEINYVLYTIMQRTEFSCFVPHFSLLKYKGYH